MGGQTPTQKPLRGGVADAGGAHQGMARGGQESREGKYRGHGECRPGGPIGGGRKLDEVRGPRPVGVQGRRPSWGSDLAGGSTDPQEEEGLLGHRPPGGDVEDSGGDSKSPFHILHNLPRLPPWIQGGSRHRYGHPLSQAASEASGLEGGGPVCGLPGPAQGV